MCIRDRFSSCSCETAATVSTMPSISLRGYFPAGGTPSGYGQRSSQSPSKYPNATSSYRYPTLHLNRLQDVVGQVFVVKFDALLEEWKELIGISLGVLVAPDEV
eukprot:TRINITY_DN8317_c0_g1_i1.p1 TRINITY_DN8317_c0_g1~~TRINITY_DN8317_c0_g1_i1.p1  ORF type:complete len:104 (-),score=8.76 TRINITY_DN8317_c0_g1_i1:203-514(-)